MGMGLGLCCCGGGGCPQFDICTDIELYIPSCFSSSNNGVFRLQHEGFRFQSPGDDTTTFQSTWADQTDNSNGVYVIGTPYRGPHFPPDTTGADPVFFLGVAPIASPPQFVNPGLAIYSSGFLMCDGPGCSDPVGPPCGRRPKGECYEDISWAEIEKDGWCCNGYPIPRRLSGTPYIRYEIAVTSDDLWPGIVNGRFKYSSGSSSPDSCSIVYDGVSFATGLAEFNSGSTLIEWEGSLDDSSASVSWNGSDFIVNYLFDESGNEMTENRRVIYAFFRRTLADS